MKGPQRQPSPPPLLPTGEGFPGEPQGRGCGHRLLPPQMSPTPSREGVLVGHMALLPAQTPGYSPSPYQGPETPQGQHTSLTAWVSLWAWGWGVHAASLDGKGE